MDSCRFRSGEHYIWRQVAVVRYLCGKIWCLRWREKLTGAMVC